VKTRAFTLVELMVVIVAVALLAAAVLWVCEAVRRHNETVNCENNLGQIGMDDRLWVDDHPYLLPAQCLTNAAGGPLFLGTNLFRYYLAVESNNIDGLTKYTPQIQEPPPGFLACPSDRERRPAKDFATDFDNSHLSYFVGLSANVYRSDLILAGDRNLTNATDPTNGVLTLTTNRLAGWTKQLHRRRGNILLTDGSVQQTSGAQLNALVSAAGTNTIRLGIP
jgi:prepilin-type N-terminal cleavage/methylation domain-containing protein